MIINKRQVTKFGLKKKVDKLLLLNVSDDEKQKLYDKLIRDKLDDWNEYHKNLYHTNDAVRKVWNERCKNNYHTNRDWAYKKRGNKCEICGSTKHLSSAHREPALKKAEVGVLMTRPDFQTHKPSLEEFDKCDVLCMKCHNLYDKSWGKLYPHLQTESGYLIFQKALKMWREEGCKGRFIEFLRKKKYFGYG